MSTTNEQSSYPSPRCCICSGAALNEIGAYRSLRRVTSDCRPWPAGGRLSVCAQCGCVQNLPDPTFIREIDEIYTAYAIYHQSDGQEQPAFDASTGEAAPRSRRLLERFLEKVTLPSKGRMLDIGCGNGATLKAFRQLRPEWSLVGTELNEKYRASVEAIAGGGGFHSGAPGAIPGEFDLVSMIHVLEHVIEPLDFLTKLQSKLSAGGILLVEVPAYQQNPFELLIADHRTHFDAESLSLLLEQAGYTVKLAAEDWVAKELSIVARPAGSQVASPPPATSAMTSRVSVERTLGWLAKIVTTARGLAANGPIGIFGTSIAATWLAAELEGDAAFFVDEDAARAGKQLMNRPIYAPRDLDGTFDVFVALPHKLAESVARRLARVDVRYHISPEE